MTEPVSGVSLPSSAEKALSHSHDASQRVRRVVLVLLLACAIVFVAWLNELRDGWTVTRLKVARWSADVLNCTEYQREPDPTDKTKDYHLACIRVEGLDASQSAAAQAYIERRNLTVESVQAHIQALQDVVVKDVVFVRMPFIGIAADVNDLSVIAGLGFTVILLFLYFSVLREYANLTYLFHNPALAADRKEMYAYLTMTQIFMLPKIVDGLPPHVAVLRRVRYGIFALPAILQGMIAVNDLVDIKYAHQIDPSAAIRMAVGDVAGFLLVAAMAIAIGYKAQQMLQLWDEAFTEIFGSRAPVPPAATA